MKKNTLNMLFCVFFGFYIHCFREMLILRNVFEIS